MENADSAVSAPDYKLSDAVNLYSQQTSIVNQLWAFYVAATFAAASFGASGKSVDRDVAFAVLLGFWAFTLGHLSLIRQGLQLIRRLREDIRRAVSQHGASSAFIPTLSRLKANPPWISITAHLIIDVCVTIAVVKRIA